MAGTDDTDHTVTVWVVNVDRGAKMVGIYPGEEPGEIRRPSDYYTGALTTKAAEDEEHWLRTSAKF